MNVHIDVIFTARQQKLRWEVCDADKETSVESSEHKFDEIDEAVMSAMDYCREQGHTVVKSVGKSLPQVRRGKRPGRKTSWDEWIRDFPLWTHNELRSAWLLAHGAWASSHMTAMYAGLGECRAIEDEWDRRGTESHPRL